MPNQSYTLVKKRMLPCEIVYELGMFSVVSRICSDNYIAWAVPYKSLANNKILIQSKKMLHSSA